MSDTTRKDGEWVGEELERLLEALGRGEVPVTRRAALASVLEGLRSGSVRLSKFTLKRVLKSIGRELGVGPKAVVRKPRKVHYAVKRMQKRERYRAKPEAEKLRQAKYRDSLWGSWVRARRDAKRSGSVWAIPYEWWQKFWLDNPDAWSLRREGKLWLARVDTTKPWTTDNLTLCDSALKRSTKR